MQLTYLASGKKKDLQHSMQRGKWVSQTLLMEFLLLGLGDARELQTPLFLLCLATYTVTMVGKILIIVLVVRDPHLHTPMHFFLMNLSGLETCYSSTIPPRLLASFLTGDTTISVQGCMAQFFFSPSPTFSPEQTGRLATEGRRTRRPRLECSTTLMSLKKRRRWLTGSTRVSH